jgi:hypothetical protein
MSRRMLAETAQGKGFGPQIPDPPRHTLGSPGPLLFHFRRTFSGVGPFNVDATQEKSRPTPDPLRAARSVSGRLGCLLTSLVDRFAPWPKCDSSGPEQGRPLNSGPSAASTLRSPEPLKLTVASRLPVAARTLSCTIVREVLRPSLIHRARQRRLPGRRSERSAAKVRSPTVVGHEPHYLCRLIRSTRRHGRSRFSFGSAILIR